MDTSYRERATEAPPVLSLEPRRGRGKALHRYSTALQAVVFFSDLVAFVAAAYVATGLVDHQWGWQNFAARVTASGIKTVPPAGR